MWSKGETASHFLGEAQELTEAQANVAKERTLLPCPFCGERPYIVTKHGMWSIGCAQCRYGLAVTMDRHGEATYHIRSFAAAQRVWNKRTT